MKKNLKFKKVLKASVVCLCMVMVMGLMAGCGGKESRAITVISREDGSGTRGAFTELMGIKVDDIDNTTPNAEISQSTAVVMTTVAGNSKSIGYISLGSLNDTVKSIKVDGVEATVENIKAGTYAVARPFLAVTNDSLTDIARDFLDYVMSSDGQKIIAEDGYITVDDGATPYEVKKGMKGKIVLAGSTSVAPVMQKLADGYKGINPEVVLEIQQTGSGAGITAIIENACDIGMSSRNLKDEEVAQGILGTAIAMDGIAVIVNNESPVEDLSSEEIRQIFTGEVTDWSQIPGVAD